MAVLSMARQHRLMQLQHTLGILASCDRNKCSHSGCTVACLQKLLLNASQECKWRVLMQLPCPTAVLF